ncbi:hypothetical protein E6O75_ATG00748 [Venturia nashicola]|uniref:Uncharacterized protein n=1 Tax=Venturia nashicola TaxID=86259 RepID=A0A4Z1PEP3_9PEZI|nr:hypothetical protein E6O75_ATG00748 [Venturia nashicola]
MRNINDPRYKVPHFLHSLTPQNNLSRHPTSMPPKKLLASQSRKGMYALIEDEFDDEVDAEICEVIVESALKGNTYWPATADTRMIEMIDMEETKQ